MPELPEVEALAAYLRERAAGHVVSRAEVAAISVLKTFDPPVTALTGKKIVGASRRGKYLQVALEDDLLLITHLARAGWLHYRESFPATAPLKPGKGPIGFRLRLDDGSGFDLTEAGTQKKLAVYVVKDPQQVPGIATLGPEPLDLTLEEFAKLIRAQSGQIKGVLRSQRIIAGIGNAYSDEILHAAKLSPFALTGKLTDAQRGLVRRFEPAVLPDLPDGRKAAGRPAPVQATEVTRNPFRQRP